MKYHGQVAAFILAGGNSSRMGRDKGLLDFAGVPLIVKTVRLLEQLVCEVVVVGSPDRYVRLGLRVIRDREISRSDELNLGPLVGIASALHVTETPWNLILACDLPYLSGAWIDWLLSRATQSSAQVVMPQTTHGVEPLAAVYRRECVSAIDASLAHGFRKVSDALRDLRVELIHSREWRKFDPHGRVLTNMNTLADYAEARKHRPIA
ncbi:MAG TPA: molybdenum cofactor guanylyltransferase [Candidatus Dormibacteraeota bacterium]|nr:molybdenum cofactor guanylyltransferase [Candidatus Dormibacteraeota bacterium]